jgi:predicted PurR-regulated permease PerM
MTGANAGWRSTSARDWGIRMSTIDRSTRNADRQAAFWFVAIAALLAVVWMLRDILLPFVVGAGIAYLLNPLADRLARTGLGRTPAAGLIIVAAALLLALAIILLGPLLFDQLRQLAETLPADLKRLAVVVDAWAKDWLGPRYDAVHESVQRSMSGVSQSWTGTLTWALEQLWGRGLALVNLLSLLLITPVVAFYLLADWPRVTARIDQMLPRDHAPVIRSLGAEINDAVSAFVRGQGTLCLILAAIYAIGLMLIGVRYGLLIGVVAGLLGFVPFVGWALGLGLAGAMAVAQGWPELGLLVKVVVLFAAVAALDTALLSPKIVGSRVGLHPVWLIFSVLAFGSLIGTAGVLIAVPVAAAIAVLVRFALRAYLESDIYRGDAPSAAPVATAGDVSTSEPPSGTAV